jgi:hypothetical protein
MIVFVSARSGQQVEVSAEDWEKSLQVTERFVEHYFNCPNCQVGCYRGICVEGFNILTGGCLGQPIN